MSRPSDTESLDVVELLREEHREIHGQLPEGYNDWDQELADLDGRLRRFYASVHAVEPSRSALCLSGGGIRSASFCLGVLQELARVGTLQRFNYLSTVSGGGYIGSWLSAWIHRHFVRSRDQSDRGKPGSRTAGEREPRADLLDGVSDHLAISPGTRNGHATAGLGGACPPEPEEVSHLRRFTNYLTPHTGLLSLDTWTLAAIYVRNLLLNWTVVIPLLVGVLALPHLLAAVLDWRGVADADFFVVFGLPAGAVLWWALLAVVLVLYVRIRALDPFENWRRRIERLFQRLGIREVGEPEGLARREGQLLRFALAWVAVAGLALYASKLAEGALGLLAVGGGATGIATSILKKLGNRSGTMRTDGRRSTRFLRLATTVAALGTLVAILTAVAVGVEVLVEWGTRVGSRYVGTGSETTLVGAIMIASGGFVISAVAALFVDVNEFSLHALYRNRLVRAFLRASRGAEAPRRDEVFDRADDLELVKLWPAEWWQRDDREPGQEDSGEAEPEERETLSERNQPHLFHVINATLNDVGGARTEWSERKGVSFTFSPLHFGAHIPGRHQDSDETGESGGYRRLRREPDERKGDRLSLGTAMTISGAAANPSMGYHSSPLVTALMALFNVRLGWWMRAPWRDEIVSTKLPTGPRAVWGAWISEALGLTRLDSATVNVSDGGHFDNLGLYEMIRRRCRYVVVVDASEDGEGDFASLGEALRKIRVDFGVRITFTGLDLSDGEPGSQETPTPPIHAWTGTIHYSSVDERIVESGGEGVPPRKAARDGTIVYLKPAVSGDEPVDVQAYRRLQRDFPHESTMDQWFSESQFESYRSLGIHSVRTLLDYYDAYKDQLDQTDDVRRHERSALPDDPPADQSTHEPEEFCHRIAEALALMKRNRRRSTHAGGIVHRTTDDGELEFLLVESIDHTCRVLPKGHIEPWEDATTAAVREVREETGFDLEPERILGVFPFEKGTEKLTVTYFLMEAKAQRAPSEPYEAFRAPRWFTLDEAEEADDPGVPDDVKKILEEARQTIERGR